MCPYINCFKQLLDIVNDACSLISLFCILSQIMVNLKIDPEITYKFNILLSGSKACTLV